MTAGERNVLTRLVQDGQLPSSVINVLVWYVIADLGNATLKGNFVDAIANDWLRAGVKDGAGALMQLKKFNQAKREGRQSRAPAAPIVSCRSGKRCRSGASRIKSRRRRRPRRKPLRVPEPFSENILETGEMIGITK